MYRARIALGAALAFAHDRRAPRLVRLERDQLGAVLERAPSSAARSASIGSRPIWVTKIRGDGLRCSTPSLMLRK